MIDALQLRDNARNQLLEIRDIESGLDYLNKVKAIEVWARAEKKDAELQNLIAEQKLRTQRVLGRLIQEGQDNGEIATQSENGGGVQPGLPLGKTRKSISDVGISHKQSSAFKQIASIPDETFEEFIAEKKQAVNDAVAELTTSGAVRLAKSLKDERDELKTVQDLSKRLSEEDELKRIAKEINMTYTKEQRQYFVTLIKI